ncbi:MULTISPECIES: VOC family protein [unclassified Streptomyces]|uniref:VOC family protein n=1 Tax=unclassified Streptomyces TaxID=2593676 RepID=UPI00364F15CF
MIDHISVQVRDPAVSAAFYDRVLATLGGKRMIERNDGEVIGYGTTHPTFWIGPATSDEVEAAHELHIAFSSADRAGVRAFHAAAVEAGAEVLHEPRVWPVYHPAYYGAFVRDPDGNNVEAVCHVPE